MTDTSKTETQTPPLSDAAIGAVAALIRVSELYDPAVAHRAALRAIVASRLAAHVDSPVDRSVLIATAALGNVDLAITRPNEPEANNDAMRTLLADTLLGRLRGLRDVAKGVRAHLEWWDGNGAPDGLAGGAIPIAARVAAVADVLVGDPAAGYVPSWEHARRRMLRVQGTKLDPNLCQIAATIDLENLEAPVISSDAITELLEHSRFADPTTYTTHPATTIKSAVAAAGEPKALLTLFADTARTMLSADEVLVLRATDTYLDHTPAASVIDDGRPRIPRTRLESLFEFSVQAEVRAGVAMIGASADDGHHDQLIAPIMVGDTCSGAIVAMRGRDLAAFDAHDVSVLRHIASEAATAVVKTEHWAEMERMALRDQLTGLANRHELYRVLDRIFERPAVERLDVALIMCDVDGLKIVNDTMGHQAGDRLLIDAAASMRGAVRDLERTTVCRIGGDEFCMVIDGGALLTAHDVSDTIERLFARSGGSDDERSISCGIAFATEEISSRSALLRAADENQYETKRTRKAARSTEPLAADAKSRVAPPDRRALRD